jgi:hypothetical protein
MIWNLQTDLFRIPLVFEPATYSFAATVVLISAAVSGLIVRRKLDHRSGSCVENEGVGILTGNAGWD